MGEKGEMLFNFLGIRDKNYNEKLKRKEKKHLSLHVYDITFASIRKIGFSIAVFPTNISFQEHVLAII